MSRNSTKNNHTPTKGFLFLSFFFICPHAGCPSLLQRRLGDRTDQGGDAVRHESRGFPAHIRQPSLLQTRQFQPNEGRGQPAPQRAHPLRDLPLLSPLQVSNQLHQALGPIDVGFSGLVNVILSTSHLFSIFLYLCFCCCLLFVFKKNHFYMVDLFYEGVLCRTTYNAALSNLYNFDCVVAVFCYIFYYTVLGLVDLATLPLGVACRGST